MPRKKNTYSFAFIGAYSLIHESVTVAELFKKNHDWDLVGDMVMRGNMLQKVKRATVVRELREIRKRLSTLSEQELNLLVSGDLAQTKAILLIGVAKTYLFIKDFVVEVLRNKYLSQEFMLFESDYQRFIDSKSVIHPELDELTDKSKHKIRLVILQILTQLGLLSNKNERTITGQRLDRSVVTAIVQDDPALLRVFLYSDNDIESMKRKHK